VQVLRVLVLLDESEVAAAAVSAAFNNYALLTTMYCAVTSAGAAGVGAAG
jgi:hypothetical protein